MTGLADLIEPGCVEAGLSLRSRKAVFAHIGALAARQIGLDADAVTDGLAERERLGSTGFGGGVAIPHARIVDVGRPRAIMLSLAAPVGYRAVDDMPVDLIVALLSPPDAGAEHLKALARVSRALRDPALVAKLRGAGSEDAAYALLAGVEARDAA